MRLPLLLAISALAAAAVTALAQSHDQQAMEHSHGAAPAGDARAIVHFPAEMRLHTLANMRDHLLALQEIQLALAREEFDRAGEIAEARLGMSSLTLHGAHDASRYMPAGMQAIGTQMHRTASRLAVAAKDAGATGDVKPVLAAMARVSEQCVACHAAFRVQ